MGNVEKEDLSRNQPSFYRPELDVLRFLAFLLVFLHHVLNAKSPIGQAVQLASASGVCLFFLLSSYLITELLQREAASTGTINLRAFYVRRILRIWPLYFGFLLFGYAIDRFSHPHQLSVGSIFAFLFLAGNWYAAKYGFVVSVVSPLWSISVEEQFYLFWPSLRRFFGPYTALITAFATLPAAYITIAWLCHRNASLYIQIWTNTLVQAQFFGIGAVLAFLLRGRIPRLHSAVRLGLFSFGLLFLFIGQYVFHVKNLLGTSSVRETSCGYLCFAAGCTALLFSFLGFSRIRSWRLPIYLGKISYGLYVFHMLAHRIFFHTLDPFFRRLQLTGTVADALRVLLVLAICVLLAHLSYLHVERPFLRLKDRFAIIRTRAV